MIGSAVAWLMAPLSGAASHHVDPWLAWHARTMVLAWGVLLPLGALAARYFKVTPQQDWPHVLDRKAWWHAHRGLQWSGVLLMTAGVMLAWNQSSGATPMAIWHARGGWLLLGLGWFQIVASWLRGSKGGPTDRQMRGDHYDMTARRVWFERLHKGVGWSAVLGAMGVIAVGLVVADAPRWMPISLVLWWSALAAAAFHWQREGRCIDTYQAIWGPSPQHPGNRARPLGWGVHRRSH